jgi:hypothetical protein
VCAISTVPFCTPSTHAQRRHQFAAGVGRDLELAAGHVADLLGEIFGAAEDGVQRLREAGRQAPADGGLGMDRGRHAGGQHAGDAGPLNEGTTFHENLLDR